MTINTKRNKKREGPLYNMFLSVQTEAKEGKTNRKIVMLKVDDDDHYGDDDDDEYFYASNS